MMRPVRLLLSCEHAVNTVPKVYRHLFEQHQFLLQTHRAIDFDALYIATALSKAFDCEMFQTKITRLLIDCNRSLSNANCFSTFTNLLPSNAKEALIQRYYLPYRTAIETAIQHHLQQGNQVLHLSIHSFTPMLDGDTRQTDIGLLYDPRRGGEKKVARLWKSILQEQAPNYRTRMNYPYTGISDGLMTALRKKWAETDYVGFEVEMNQALTQDHRQLRHLTEGLIESIKQLLDRL